MDDASIAAGRERWRAAYEKAPKTDRDTTTISGNETEPVYGPPPGSAVPGFERIGWPGEYPYTRGLYPTGYRGRPWTIRQFAGLGSAAQTNERFRAILAAGGGGLSVGVGKRNGTLQTDIFKEYIAQKEWLCPPEPHLRLIGDLMEYCARGIPAYKPLSVSGYHIREAGSTAAQELAYTLADGFGYVELGLSRGLDIEVFAPGLSFFFDAHIDFFEEIAKFRAARRIWARWMRDVYGAKTAKAQWLRFHTQTAGVSLTAQQPDNNIVRTAVEAMAAVLGGTNSLHTNALDEVLALPGPAAAETALRTQQVIMEATGGVNVADPLGGSWYVEALTDEMERQAEEIFARIKGMSSDGSMTSGILRGIEDGWFMAEIAEAAFSYQVKLEKGDKRIVGVNVHTSTVEQPLEILRVSHEVEREQKRVLGSRRAERDNDAVHAALARMVDVARTDENMVPAMLDAARVEATLGEICDALRGVWGSYLEPPRF